MGKLGFKNYRRLTMKTLIYDCEILKCIPGGVFRSGIEYCSGWDDYSNMGISVIAAWISWDSESQGIRVFTPSIEPAATAKFQQLVNSAELIVGFNSQRFGDRLCAANGIKITTGYDLLLEVWEAAGMPREYVPGVTRAGYNLGSLARANLGIDKTGSGALAPELWQKGHHADVIQYCINDVWITKALFENRAKLKDPTRDGYLNLREPSEFVLA